MDFGVTSDSGISGIVSSMDAIGVVLAFLASSATSFVWVDFYRSDTTLTHDDPVWVSAWWLLYIFLGFILVLSGIPFLGFPKRLPRQWEDGKGELGVNMAASEDDSIPSDNKSSQALWTTLKLGGVKGEIKIRKLLKMLVLIQQKPDPHEVNMQIIFVY